MSVRGGRERGRSARDGRGSGDDDREGPERLDAAPGAREPYGSGDRGASSHESGDAAAGGDLAAEVDGNLLEGLLADAVLSGSPVARHVLGLHLAQFFAAVEHGRLEEAATPPSADTMTPHLAGLRDGAALPPFVQPLADRPAGGGLSALAVPPHMHGDMVRSLRLALRAELDADEASPASASPSLADVLAAHLREPEAPALEVRPMARGGLAPHVLRRVTERMANDLAEELDLPTLAAEARLSPWHFARAFKQSTGEPPHAYRTRLRIEQAKAMLAETNEPVTAIAEAVGYDSAQSLARAFRKLTGRSPSAFRRASRA